MLDEIWHASLGGLDGEDIEVVFAGGGGVVGGRGGKWGEGVRY